ncbi:zinc finger, C3HC4 type (RING finger) domain-containing protein, partial [Cardiosporidium cionae]
KDFKVSPHLYKTFSEEDKMDGMPISGDEESDEEKFSTGNLLKGEREASMKKKLHLEGDEIVPPHVYTSRELMKQLLRIMEFLYLKFQKFSLEDNLKDSNISSSLEYFGNIYKLQSLCDDLHEKYRREVASLSLSQSQITDLEEEIDFVKNENEKLRIEVDRQAKQKALLRFQLGNQTAESPTVESFSSLVEQKSFDIHQSESELLEIKLKNREEEIEHLKREKSVHLNHINDLTTTNILTNERVIKSEVFQTLKKECTELNSELATRTAENEELRNSLVKEVNQRDEEYEKFMKQTQVHHKFLMDKISELNKEIHKNAESEASTTHELELLKDENQGLKISLNESNENLSARILQWKKLKSQYEQLKITGVQMLEKLQNLKEEKTQLINLLKEKDKEGQNLLSQLKSTSSSINENLKEDFQISSEIHTVEEFAQLQAEVANMQRRTQDYALLQGDIKELRQELQQVSEEVEEVSKAFEERQTHCEELAHQLQEAIEKSTERQASLQTLKNLSNKSTIILEQKLNTLKQKYDKSEKLMNSYVECILHANVRASLTEEQRDQYISSFLENRTSLHSATKENAELTSQLQKMKEALEQLTRKQEEMIHKQLSLETACERLKDERIVMEKRFERQKLKEIKSDRKRLSKLAIEEYTEKDVTLIAQENEELRRRFLCTVCSERFRDHIIVKCGHVFCKECLEKNVKTRNRKCSLCKINFDLKDTVKLYLD